MSQLAKSTGTTTKTVLDTLVTVRRSKMDQTVRIKTKKAKIATQTL